jgi:sarcosine oxidase, subunit beta
MARATRRYSILSLIRESRRHHSGWAPAWRKAELRRSYDVVIVGAGGHGLATAYYLAKRFGVRDVAVIEKGWLGGGNTARNTTIVRSNYLHQPSMALYGLSHGMFESLTGELGFNTWFSPRGLIELAFSQDELDSLARTADANTQFGIKSWMVPASETRSILPLLADRVGDARLLGALWQPRGGVANHNAVAWGYARAASKLGVDIIEDCAVESILTVDGRTTGVRTSRGEVSAGAVVLAAAAGSADLARSAGVHLPLEPTTLGAFVSEPLKPVLDVVVLGGANRPYLSQSNTGELVIGGATDGSGTSPRASLRTVENTAAALLGLFPSFSTLRMMRQWAGTVDLTPDRSPILGPAGPDRLYLSCGWGTGGFKAIPGGGLITASTVVHGKPHPIVQPFTVERFASGRLIDETAASAVAH